MNKVICAVIVCGACVFGFGCSEKTKTADPKPANGAGDPRLKPAEAGAGGGAAPKAGAAQGAVKGD